MCPYKFIINILNIAHCCNWTNQILEKDVKLLNEGYRGTLHLFFHVLRRALYTTLLPPYLILLRICTELLTKSIALFRLVPT